MGKDDFLALALQNPVNAAISDELQRLALPDAWLVAGCLAQTVWNVITGRAIDHGISDYDVFYFDPDTSWDAEDAVIRTLHGRLGHLGATIEIRNQARASLVLREARPALSAFDLFDGWHRPLPHAEHASGCEALGQWS